MSTPYEEISQNYSSREAVKTDSNLAQDSMQLGGIDAENYATKEYVKQAVNNKSTEDKEYTDSQIEEITETLKGYTDNVVGNIDFTPYAKKTDLEAESNNLKAHCETSCTNTLNSAKTYTDQKINELSTELENVTNEFDAEITNINVKIDGADENIEELQGKYDELFLSVSSGKELVAEAITDKGVPTSATDTFSTMAANVRSIEAGLDTSDATATANEVLRNYTAYARGEKLIGNYIAPYIPPTFPTTGTDTSDATATAQDIRYGKVAYANGQRLVGTLQTNTITNPDGSVIIRDVEEMYHLTGEGYERNNVSNFISTLEEGNELTVETLCMDIMWENASVANRAYIVRHVQESSENKYIYSNQIYNGTIVKQATASGTGEYTKKKYRYSYEELGIEGEVKKIVFGAPGYMNSQQLCLLVIIAKNLSDEWIAHFYPYHLSGEGIIGNSYDGEFNYPHRTIKLEDTFEDVDYHNFVAAKLDSNTFAYHYTWEKTGWLGSITLSNLKLLHVYDDTSAIGEKTYNFSFECRCSNIAFEASDTILNCNCNTNGSGAYCFIEKDEFGHYVIVKDQNKGATKSNISDDGVYMYVYDRTAKHEGSDIGLCYANIDYVNYNITYTLIKSGLVYAWRNANNDRTGNVNEGLGYSNNSEIRFSKDNNYIFVVLWDVGHKVYEFELSIDGENTNIVNGFKYDHGMDMTKQFFLEPNNTNEFFINGTNTLVRGKSTVSSEILAIKYKDQIFYSVKANPTGEEESVNE